MRETKRRSSLHVLLLVAACGAGVTCVLCTAPREVHASVAIAASLEDLARASSAIARVTALDRESTWEDGRIVTYTRIRVDAVIAGSTPAAARELRVRTLGGTVGNIGQIVEGEAQLAPSESSIVFLKERSSTTGPTAIIVGRAQGQLLVRRDVHGREVVRVGAVGELVDRRLRPPLLAAGRRIVELDGGLVETVSVDAKRAWEAGHAR